MHPFNRSGAPPNFQYVHGSLLQNIVRDGFDPKRATPGIVIFCDDDASKKHLLEWNEGLASGNDLCPPVNKQRMVYGTLAASHMTLALRAFKAKMYSSITGSVFPVPADGPMLHNVVEHGHNYYVLDSKVSKSDAEFLSEWKNSDQNQNQGNSEAQLVRTLQKLLIAEMEAHGPQVDLMGWLSAEGTGAPELSQPGPLCFWLPASCGYTARPIK